MLDDAKYLSEIHVIGLPLMIGFETRGDLCYGSFHLRNARFTLIVDEVDLDGILECAKRTLSYGMENVKSWLLQVLLHMHR